MLAVVEAEAVITTSVLLVVFIGFHSFRRDSSSSFVGPFSRAPQVRETRVTCEGACTQLTLANRTQLLAPPAKPTNCCSRNLTANFPSAEIQTHRQPRLLTIYSINQSRCECPEQHPVDCATKENFSRWIFGWVHAQTPKPEIHRRKIHDAFTTPRHRTSQYRRIRVEMLTFCPAVGLT
jgi:hypothetical protein